MDWLEHRLDVFLRFGGGEIFLQKVFIFLIEDCVLVGVGLKLSFHRFEVFLKFENVQVLHVAVFF